MENLNINTLNDLYERLIPALNVKVNEIKRLGIKYIKKEDVWNYLFEKVWALKSNLTLSEMVDDIINVDTNCLDKYLKYKFQNTKREINFDNNNIL